MSRGEPLFSNGQRLPDSQIRTDADRARTHAAAPEVAVCGAVRLNFKLCFSLSLFLSVSATVAGDVRPRQRRQRAPRVPGVRSDREEERQLAALRVHQRTRRPARLRGDSLHDEVTFSSVSLYVCSRIHFCRGNHGRV